jgi:RNA polymerase sigma-70 factor (ECF subfamily)
MKDTRSAASVAAASEQDDDDARIRESVLRAVRSICPSWLRDRSEDLAHAAMMRVMDVRKKSEAERDFSASYLRRAAYTALVDEIRRLRRKREVPFDVVAASAVSAATSTDPESMAAAKELGRAIVACLKGLARERRLAVTLYLQGHAIAEAARLLEFTVKRTENLAYRGLADLRDCLASKGLAP